MKKSYRQLSLKCHPDKTSDPEAPATFVKLTEAYKFLMGNKTLYDNLLRQHDLSYFRERLILVNRETQDEFEVEITDK